MVFVRKGLIEWLEIGGRRWNDVKATFATDDKGAFNDPYTAGVVGEGFLRPFVVTLDYQNRRIAFRPRAAP